MSTVKDVRWVAAPSGTWLQRRSATATRAEVRGPVMTMHGIVFVEQYFRYGFSPHERWLVLLHYCVHTNEYRRIITRGMPYSTRYLVTLSRRFAEEKYCEAWR